MDSKPRENNLIKGGETGLEFVLLMAFFLLINGVFWLELLPHVCPYFAFSHLVRQESEKYLELEACASKLPASCLTPFKIKPESKVKYTKATKVNELITINFLN